MSFRTGIAAFFVIVSAVAAVALGYFAFPSNHATVFTAAGIGPNGEGVMVPFEMELKPGTGRLLVNVQDTIYSEDVEDSLRQARLAAENYLGVALESYDIVVDLSRSQQVVSGGSAGAAFAVAIIASYLQRPVREDTAISATLKSEKEIGPVDGIEEKIIAASAAGKKTFLISQEQLLKHETQMQSVAHVVRIRTIDQAVEYLVA